jgi:isopenicillin N synthase-like dioxygenase
MLVFLQHMMCQRDTSSTVTHTETMSIARELKFPILDFNVDDDDDDLVKRFIDALTKIGFVAIRFKSDIVEQTKRQAKKALSVEIKTMIDHHPRKGLSPYKSENFACLLGQKAKNDKVVKYRYVIGNSDETPLDRSLKTCFEEMCKVSKRVLRLLAKGLKLRDENYWISSQENISTLTANYYPSLLEDDEDFDMQVHTDVDFMTLVSSDRPGLEIEWSDRKTWVQAPYGPNMFILNVADALSEWPGLTKMFKSTKHRVMCPIRGKDRISLAFFVAPHPSTKMCNPYEANHDDAITYKKWRRKRIARALKALRTCGD